MELLGGVRSVRARFYNDRYRGAPDLLAAIVAQVLRAAGDLPNHRKALVRQLADCEADF